MTRVALILLMTATFSVSACAAEIPADVEVKTEQELSSPVAVAAFDEGDLGRADESENSSSQQELTQDENKTQKYAQIRQDLPGRPVVPSGINCKGVAKQGGAMLCKTRPNTKVKVGRAEDDFYYETSNNEGYLIIGFDRDETRTFLEVDGVRKEFKLTPRDYDTSRIDGLPKNMVSEYTKEELVRIKAATARKKVGFASRVDDIGLKDGFIYPVKKHIKTTNFGAQRILNGTPKRPHFGVDLAAPKGTPIIAPADGIVSMADEDMYFEGSLLLIDHGQGLISYYLHMDDITVENGDRVVQGQKIATVGSKGRSTGPHLCWRLKWRNRNLDPELLTEWPQ